MTSFEEQRVAALAENDDWQSSWERCKQLGLKWGGRGMGGRATGRCTVQTRDVVVEGCTMSYFGNNLLNRTTLRLLNGRVYGLIGRNGVGKTTLFQRIYTGTLPGFPPHISVSLVQQELPSVSDSAMNVVEYIVQNDPRRNLLEKQIDMLENAQESDAKDPAEQADMLSSLYDMIEDEGVVMARAVKILKDLGFRYF
jgi:ATP-binding cassette subfamily F protein 3